MAKKSIKDAVSVFDTIATGNAKGTQDTQNTQNADATEYGRINLKLPTEVKEYLAVAAAKESIKRKRTVSITQYLCDLVKEDMERKGDA